MPPLRDNDSPASKRVLAAAACPELVGRIEELLLATTAADFARVSDGGAALTAATSRTFQLIVAEYPLPELDMEAFLARLREPDSASREASVVVLSGSLDRAVLGGLGRRRLAGVHLCTNTRQTLRAVSEHLRLSDRLPARLRVIVDGAETATTYRQLTWTRNISPSGMLLDGEHLLPIGMVTPIAIELAGDQPLVRGRAEVVRHADPEREEVFGMGLQFVRLYGGDDRRLAEFVHEGLRKRRTSVRGAVPEPLPSHLTAQRIS